MPLFCSLPFPTGHSPSRLDVLLHLNAASLHHLPSDAMSGSRTSTAARTASSSLRSCSYRSGMHISSKAYNPYRPDPPELPKPPRRVVMKNLKFGRLAQAASAGVEGARRSLVETTSVPDTHTGQSSFHSSSQSSSNALSSSSPSSSSSQGNSTNAAYKKGQHLPIGLLALLAACTAGAATVYSQSSGGDNANETAGNLALLEAVSIIDILRDASC